jgi:hypothetical protein
MSVKDKNAPAQQALELSLCIDNGNGWPDRNKIGAAVCCGLLGPQQSTQCRITDAVLAVFDGARKVIFDARIGSHRDHEVVPPAEVAKRKVPRFRLPGMCLTSSMLRLWLLAEIASARWIESGSEATSPPEPVVLRNSRRPSLLTSALPFRSFRLATGSMGSNRVCRPHEWFPNSE